MNARLLQIVAALVVFLAKSSAATLTYQPSPFRGTNVWLSSYYDYGSNYGVSNSELRVGGWGDWYYSALKFDLEGLPANPTAVALYLWAYSPGGGATPVSMNAYALTNDWDQDSGMYTVSWSGYGLGTLSAPTMGQFNGVTITSVYNYWKNGTIANKGFLFTPTGNSNQFNYYYSSKYSIPLYRPYLVVTYSETVTPPSLKLPLPGSKSWVVTTEIGGWDEKNPTWFPSSHTGSNYFSIDFGPASIPSYSGDIPIYAAAGGKIATIGDDPNHPNGYHIVINHSYVQNETTGYTTRYLHLKGSPRSTPASLTEGDTVTQGQILGYMGNTGTTDVHLHFGVRYGNSGASSVNELAFVKMEGIPLKQYQTETDSSGNRHANSYFPSTNTP